MGMIVTSPTDRSWELWGEKAAARAPTARWLRVHTAALPASLHVTVDDAGPGDAAPARWLQAEGEAALDLARLDVVWLKRMWALGEGSSAFEHAPDEARDRRAALETVVSAALRDAGVCVVIDDVAKAHLTGKPLQHEAARRVGLRVPRTLVSNDGPTLRAFVAACPRGAIYKTLGRVDLEGAVVRTNLIAVEDLDDDEALRLAPLLLQERVERRHELRVTVIGDRIFAASVVDSEPSHEVDWRRGQETRTLRWERAELPAVVATALLSLMDLLGLTWGAADFIVTNDDEHVFLEVNPGGEFLFVEHFVGYPLADALLDHFERGPLPHTRAWTAALPPEGQGESSGA